MLKPGTRVQMHAATDHWMRGDRYGTVVGLGRVREYVALDGERVNARPLRVKLDRSGKVVRVHASNVFELDGAE